MAARANLAVQAGGVAMTIPSIADASISSRPVAGTMRQTGRRKRRRWEISARDARECASPPRPAIVRM